MKKATITQTKNQLSALIDQVRHGETILIMDRGRPVARLESVLGDAAQDAEGRLARLERSGLIRRGLAAPPVKEILAQKPPKAAKNASILAALISEREEGR